MSTIFFICNITPIYRHHYIIIINFAKVKTVDEKVTIGKISKYWSGFVNDLFTNADNFGIHVPADLDVTLKAAMIGACFLFVSLI